MAKRYQDVRHLAEQIRRRREARGLTFEQLGLLAQVDGAQAWRICRGEFATLNPSVLKICSALGIQPKAEGLTVPVSEHGSVESMLAAEVVAAWDRTEEGARLLTRVLRALHKR